MKLNNEFKLPIMNNTLTTLNFEEKKVDENTIEITPKFSKKEKRKIRDLKLDKVVIQIDGFSDDDLNKLRELNIVSIPSNTNSLLNKLASLVKLSFK